MSDRETSDREHESGESDNETQPQVGTENSILGIFLLFLATH